MRKAVVVLGSGGYEGRLTEENILRLDEGAHEYDRCEYDYIIVTDGFVGRFMAHYLIFEKKIPVSKILVGNLARDTFENKIEVLNLCVNHGIGEIALVTSDYHLLVAHMIFWHSALKIRRVPVKPLRIISWKKRLIYGWIYPLYILFDPYGRMWPARRIRASRQNRLEAIRFSEGAP